MEKDQLLKLMDAIPFFGEMDREERERLLAQDSHWVHFKPGEKILKEGEVDYGFYVLLEGKVSVVRDQPPEISLAQLVPGAIFGEITLKAQRPRSSSIAADDEVFVFKVDNPLVDQIKPELVIKIKDQIIQLVITRLDEVNTKLSSFIR
ncbi:MAG: cyclic nucleotide-binding domain-containing protein [Nitrospinaceae bacterium]|nr:cyclic nucleotide-binding domain-containing protein [Nitrospinaceae bacterium]NIR56112.1 cyclic nucleotide-binding domain-containing protein [Nitrospinaceae bacterium]NIS86560.1 cyclic nucleotide-binding domain-containing protein [Nitrospinaceae bacterium]NIT83394.1 cyclic nucleotide-binding domain-containing protein [Nitrospinaceae bacterium]NIU45604.1 cyclic nucleotide-binding domain-containing protein [Nitrospinaceae bacterium]